jgi:biopolymer transport protein TolR
MAMDIGQKGSLKADINVTPLVDVMLVLLIIMMLVAPLLQKGVAVNLPIAGNTVEKPDTQDQTVVSIDAQNQFWVDGVQVPKAEMANRVQSKLENKKERVVLLKGDTDAKYSAIMEAMDDLRKSNIEDIGLITEPPPNQRDQQSQNRFSRPGGGR